MAGAVKIGDRVIAREDGLEYCGTAWAFGMIGMVEHVWVVLPYRPRPVAFKRSDVEPIWSPFARSVIDVLRGQMACARKFGRDIPAMTQGGGEDLDVRRRR